jgi:hypothetical protein
MLVEDNVDKNINQKCKTNNNNSNDNRLVLVDNHYTVNIPQYGNFHFIQINSTL